MLGEAEQNSWTVHPLPSDNTPTWHSSSVFIETTPFLKWSTANYVCKTSDLGKVTQWMVTSV